MPQDEITVNLALTLAAGLNTLAALLHFGCIVFGASWYRFFGAGERMARMAERGEWRPAFITGLIVVVLSAWAAYALSGAGMLRCVLVTRLRRVGGRRRAEGRESPVLALEFADLPRLRPDPCGRRVPALGDVVSTGR